MKYILLSLLLIGQVFGQIINNDGGTTIDGNLTVATNLSVGGGAELVAASNTGNPFVYETISGIKCGVGYYSSGLTLGSQGNSFAYVKSGSFTVPTPSYYGFASGGGWSGSADTRLYRDDAGTLALRNGTASNVFRAYGTYTDASNYERVSLSHNGAGTAVLAAETAGTGTDAQSLKIQLAGNGALYVDGDTAGNARGNNAVDLQVKRAAATQVASGANSSVLGGLQNSATGAGSVTVGGYGLVAAGAYSCALGTLAEATSSATYGFASGYYAKSYLYAQRSFASGLFSSKGDAQGSRLLALNTTTGTTPADLFLDGVDDRLVLPANTSWKFTVEVTGRGTDAGAGAEEVASYEFKGTITRDGANNTSFPWPVTKTVEGESDATWDVTVSADDTNEALNISCTGGSGDNVRWVAIINLVEVGG